jgi:hypothetical protein
MVEVRKNNVRVRIITSEVRNCIKIGHATHLTRIGLISISSLFLCINLENKTKFNRFLVVFCIYIHFDINQYLQILMCNLYSLLQRLHDMNERC